MTLGQKIRARRKELKLTQQELAGSDITRNMLSQIENDITLPSLATLTMLSRKLKLATGYFLSSNDDALMYLKLETQPKLLSLYREGKYESCIKLADKTYGTLDDDETAYFRCATNVKAAENALYSGAMQKALKYADSAMIYSNKTSYDVEHLVCVAILISAISQNPNAPRLEFNETQYHQLVASASKKDLYHYLIDDLNYSYADPILQEHILAKKLMKQNKFDLAYQKMNQIYINQAAPPINAYVLWRLFGDMETCARNLKDFENAYRISIKRMSLSTAFQSS